MEKSSAIRLLTDTLQRPFDEAQFRQFARNLVNDLDESKAFQVQGNYIKDAYKHQVRQYKRIGQYVDPDGNTIDVLVVRLQQPTSLDRARTMQRNFIAQYLQDRNQKEAALVAYTTDGSPDWRFSLVRLDYRLEQQEDGSYKPKKEVTAARRSSFLVGQTEPNHTAQQQLLPLLLNDRQNPTLDELEAAFNIESVTKEFFEQYKNLFLQVRDEVETLRQTDPVIATDFTQKQIDPANFAKKLLGQIVFLYFLQKKGWLGVEPGQPWGSGAKDFLRRLFQQENVQYDNFFNDVLEPLFYQALAIDRGREALYELPGCQQPCKIPFLNGGLFEPIGGYDWQTTNVFIANATIQNILDTFDLYNFTVREDEPLDKEVAVDPEMLGKVFENLLEVKDRKSKGAFYTPREIVHYMCQESLINYLDTTIHQVPRGDLERLIRQGERAIENDAVVVQKGSETVTYQFQVPESVRTYAAEIDQALADIKICDPAIGSGAFPVGMMQEIVKVRGVLTTYLSLTPNSSTWGEGSSPSPPAPLPRERGAGSPLSPWGEGGRGDEGDTVPPTPLCPSPPAPLPRERGAGSPPSPWGEGGRGDEGDTVPPAPLCPSPPAPLPRERGAGSPPSPWGEGGRGDEGDTVPPAPLCPSPPAPLPRERGAGSPPSPWGEGGRGDEGDTVPPAPLCPSPPAPLPRERGAGSPPSPWGEGGRGDEGDTVPPTPLCPSPPAPLPRERGAGSPPSPWGEGGRGDEGDTVAGKLRQVPRALLERARELRSTQTATEQILWECLRDRRLNNFKFRRQHNIGQYIADFYCHEARLVIELDGGIHQTQTDRDRDRNAWMQSQNLRVLRLANEQVLGNLETVLQAILNALTPSPSPWGEGSLPSPPAPLPRERGAGSPPSPWGEGGRGDEGDTVPPAPLPPSPNPLPGERGAGSPPSPWGEGGRGDEGRSTYAFKRHAIQSSIYGVDIDPGAVDIAKLRLWLSLVVDEEDYESIKPLPNLDYKIVCGNSLLSVEKNLFNHQVFAELEQRKQEYFEETNPDRKAALRTTIQGLIQTITNQAEIFDFEVYFSEVFQQQGGFDVVIGNPPYVRQEQIKHLKDLLKPHYESFTGTADLYVFFYEKGLNLLRENGVLTYISSNKWFRAAYGKKLRQLIARETQLQQIIDFGDAPVFAAIAYPAIVITQKGKPSSPSPFSLGEKGSKTDPEALSLGRGARGTVLPSSPQPPSPQGEGGDPAPLSLGRGAGGEGKLPSPQGEGGDPAPLSLGRGARGTVSPSSPRPPSPQGEGGDPEALSLGRGLGEGFRALNWQPGQPISQFETVVQSQSFAMPQQGLTADGWQFADTTALNLLEKLRNAGTPLGEYVNNRFYYGIKTGCNEAFVVDRATRDRLIAEHPSSAEVLKPFLRGRDVKRWIVDYQDLWLLFIPWHFPLHLDPTIEGASKKAEQAFKEQYPAIYKHLLGFKTELSNRNKAETGIRYEWYALQRCAASSWQELSYPKIIFSRFMDKPTFAFDETGSYPNNALWLISRVDKYIVAILNSQVAWWFLKQRSTDLQNGYLQIFRENLAQLSIPPASPADRASIETLVQQCIDAQGKNVTAYEAEIDNIVARLYGLTDAERAIIAGREG